MESNQTSYVNQQAADKLDKKTLNKMVWRSYNLQASFNYERMQAGGWLYSILPGLEKIHTNKEDLSTSMKHNLEFFNTHPFLINFVMGIILSLEQNKADVQTIRAVRTAAMGPLGGIGDALFWFTLVPILAGITSQMALSGSVLGPILFFVVFNLIQYGIRYFLMHWSYNTGVDAIEILTENATEFTRAASILGVFVVGALTVTYGNTTVDGINIPNGETEETQAITEIVSADQLPTYQDIIFEDQEESTPRLGQEDAVIKELPSGQYEVTYNEIQTVPVTIKIQEILDGILPKLIPLAITMMLYFLQIKKGWTPLKCILLLLIIGLIGAGPFGLWPNIWAAPM
ncbi:PTS system mannose/fructose/sorbose family transporter subunit IID [Facklamia sp. DSM 111018]|uniref:PTS system mannose/fructose/sorbose family transporter subunit IID n=1 Tax=Facklamia lactis TaxID=2749967 RepID=A0ABS0LP08_9LACT|nr:PTS system mannose/fructose/sorbose family transporter subunit IID [Facklamia lactis]MBG9979552.1 PTS system mannose/fructose/sorbose family transporter subunit IID [Facklamia lactis]MBG9985779.1 PTS system mannose/fructose/sorbose family transporter subunit IID [Facklamia lactis]